ncbi:MAG TPA: amine oxidase, partial [Methanocorpusculum sp.]|nr:amine oxidase [Methanocorpusculum sp.]
TSEIHHTDLYIDRFAGPVYVTGYKDTIPPVDAGENLFIAGMFSPENYPERSMEGSISAGMNAAKILEEKNR